MAQPMLTDEVVAVPEETLKTTSLVLALALVAGSTACVAERSLGPQAAVASPVAHVAAAPSQVPLLFVVDGVRMQRDQVPSLTAEQISAVTVLKGTAALRQYGQDGAYGVVIIKTKMAVQGS
jgi:TonB-dependent SusC/RagA subfamily outer membrane receptor